MRHKIRFGVISSLPAAIFFGFLYLGDLGTKYRVGFFAWAGPLPYLIAIGLGGILSLAITIGGITHIVREKKKGQKIGYYVFFTIIAALPLISFYPLLIMRFSHF